MLPGRPGWPARHSIWVNVAGGARCDYIGVGEEVGVHIDELLVGVGDAHTDRIVGYKLRRGTLRTLEHVVSAGMCRRL